jgi:hypothetical protein
MAEETMDEIPANERKTHSYEFKVRWNEHNIGAFWSMG